MKLIYSRSFPYGAPLLCLRGAATKDSEVKKAIKDAGATWDGQRFAWVLYKDADEAIILLSDFRGRFGCNVVASDKMDSTYILNMEATA